MQGLFSLSTPASQALDFSRNSGAPEKILPASGADKNEFAQYVQAAQDSARLAAREASRESKPENHEIKTEETANRNDESRTEKTREGEDGEKKKEIQSDEGARAAVALANQKSEGLVLKPVLEGREIQGSGESRVAARNFRQSNFSQNQTAGHLAAAQAAKENLATAALAGKETGKSKVETAAKNRVDFLGALPTSLGEKSSEAKSSLKTTALAEAGVKDVAAHLAAVSRLNLSAKKEGETKTTDGVNEKRPVAKKTSVVHTPNELNASINAMANLEGQKESGKTGAVEIKIEGRADQAKEKSDLFTTFSRDHQVQSFHKAAESAILRAQPAELVNRIAAQIRFAVVDGKGELTVKMQPEHLGKLQIVLGKDDAGLMTAKMIVESVAVKELLESKMQNLKDHLENSGMPFGSFDVDVKGGNAQAQNESGTGEKSASFAGSQSGKGSDDEKDFVNIDLRYSDRLVNILA